MIYVQGPDGKMRISFDEKDELELWQIMDALLDTKKEENIKLAKNISWGLKQMKNKEDNLPA